MPIKDDAIIKGDRIFGGKFEVIIRFVDKNGINQDIITAFDSMPTKEMIDRRTQEVIDKHNMPEVIIKEPAIMPSISPFEALAKMQSKTVTDKTTWQDVIENKLTDKVVIK